MYIICEHKGRPRGVMVKAMDCKIVVSEFEFQSGYRIHKYTCMNYVVNSPTTGLLKGWLWH